MYQSFTKKPTVRSKSALVLEYDNEAWLSTVKAVAQRVFEVYPHSINYIDQVYATVESQLEYWMFKANSSEGKLRLTVGQLKAAILKHERDYFEFLNTEGAST